MSQPLKNLDVELYDLYVADWPGEMDFYRALATQAHARGEAVLEVACGVEWRSVWPKRARKSQDRIIPRRCWKSLDQKAPG